MKVKRIVWEFVREALWHGLNPARHVLTTDTIDRLVEMPVEVVGDYLDRILAESAMPNALSVSVTDEGKITIKGSYYSPTWVSPGKMTVRFTVETQDQETRLILKYGRPYAPALIVTCTTTAQDQEHLDWVSTIWEADEEQVVYQQVADAQMLLAVATGLVEEISPPKDLVYLSQVNMAEEVCEIEGL